MSIFPKTIAWMGGSSPKLYSELSELERALVAKFYQEQCAIWLEDWEPEACYNNAQNNVEADYFYLEKLIPLDTREIFGVVQDMMLMPRAEI